MNNEQQELLDEAYKNYSIVAGMSTQVESLKKEEFINKCKTDPEFSEKWGLKIEERELSLEERMELSPNIIETITRIDLINYIEDNGKSYNMTRMLDDKNIPTKLITITYNDKTIESYE